MEINNPKKWTFEKIWKKHRLDNFENVINWAATHPEEFMKVGPGIIRTIIKAKV